MRKFWMTCASVVLGFAVGLVLSNSVGCSWGGAPQVVVAPPSAPGATPEKPKTDKPKSIEELERELAAAKQAEVKAGQKVEAAEKALGDARIEAQKTKLYWVMGIAILLSLGCVAGFVYLPGVRKYFVYGFAACIAVAAMAWTLAAILPYLMWIGLGLLAVGGAFAFYCWRNDHKGLRQVASAVESFKDRMPGYKEHFKQLIDTDVDGWLDRTRKKLGLLKK